jgi:hypothetical protein
MSLESQPKSPLNMEILEMMALQLSEAPLLRTHSSIRAPTRFGS